MAVFVFIAGLILIYLAISGKLAAITYVLFGASK